MNEPAFQNLRPVALVDRAEIYRRCCRITLYWQPQPGTRESCPGHHLLHANHDVFIKIIGKRSVIFGCAVGLG